MDPRPFVPLDTFRAQYIRFRYQNNFDINTKLIGGDMTATTVEAALQDGGT